MMKKTKQVLTKGMHQYTMIIMMGQRCAFIKHKTLPEIIHTK